MWVKSMSLWYYCKLEPNISLQINTEMQYRAKNVDVHKDSGN